MDDLELSKEFAWERLEHLLGRPGSCITSLDNPTRAYPRPAGAFSMLSFSTIQRGF